MVDSVQIEQADAEDPYGLLYELGYGGDSGLLQPEVVAADTAMNRCKRKCIGEDDEQVFAPRFLKKNFGYGNGVFL